jgi:hypothetical protein
MREEVERFAEAMEEKLKDNDWKSGWGGCSDLYILEKIYHKLDIISHNLVEDIPTEDACVDLGNYVMMLFDNIKNRH